MPFVPFLNTAQVEMRYQWDSQHVANIFHVRSDDSLTPAVLNDIATAFRGWHEASLRQWQGNTVALREVAVRDLTTPSSIGVLLGVLANNIGTGTTETLPNNCTVAIKWGTGFTGRSYRGRTYHIGLTENMVAQNRLTQVVLDGLEIAYSAVPYLDDSPVLKLVVASRTANGQPRQVGLTTVITGPAIDPVLDSQRRRLPGRGR